jgi:cellobiose-specific phosphotransferase system component IIA
MLISCSSGQAKRTAFETMQNVREQQCHEQRGELDDCLDRDSYEEYQRQRNDTLKKN